MIALGGPTLKLNKFNGYVFRTAVSMIALGGPTLKPQVRILSLPPYSVSMIALGGPTLKLKAGSCAGRRSRSQ